MLAEQGNTVRGGRLISLLTLLCGATLCSPGKDNRLPAVPRSSAVVGVESVKIKGQTTRERSRVRLWHNMSLPGSGRRGR